MSGLLKGHDVALVVGAPVFRYYPVCSPARTCRAGLRLLHISDDPAETARAPVGDSLLGDAVLSLAALKELLVGHTPREGPKRTSSVWRHTRRQPRTGPEMAV